MRYYLSPSLMCMDMMKLTEQLRFLNSKADRLHVDIMDGHYVKNLALSASFVAQIRPYTSLPIDVHLMVEAPASFIPALLDAGADAFSLHPETICREAFRVINMLRQAGSLAAKSAQKPPACSCWGSVWPILSARRWADCY